MKRSVNSVKAYERIEALKQELRKEELGVALSDVISKFNNDTANDCVVSSVYYKEDDNTFSLYFNDKSEKEEGKDDE